MAETAWNTGPVSGRQPAWRRATDKYLAIARTNLQNRLAYVWDAVANSLLMILFIFIFAQLWRATFEAQQAAVIAGLTLNQTVWYFVWAEMLMMGKIRHVQAVSQEVKDGSLAYTLGCPYNYLLYHFASGVGESILNMGVYLAVGGLVAASQVGLLASFRPETVPLLLLVTGLAFVLDYCVMSIIALLAFFFEDVSSFMFIYHKIVFVLGGLLIPVDFLPEWLQGIARLLPFNLAVYAPSKLLVAWDPEQFAFSLVMQVIWITVMVGALSALYRYGVRRVSINGG